MNNEALYPFTAADAAGGETSYMPYLPFQLSAGQATVAVSGLLDTGATVNVLPFSVGQQLGLEWDKMERAVRLTGNLAQAPARAVVLTATVASYSPVRLACAWTRLDSPPLILGQANFFMQFDACFYRSRQEFSARPRSS